MTPDTVTLDRTHIWHPFTQEATAPDPIPIARAKGAVLYTEDKREIIDLISSWWVNLHGHGHPRIAEAIAHQARTLEQVIFAGFTHRPAADLASRIAALLPDPLTRAFFSDNGSTAVEVALKLAYQYWRNRGDHHRKRFLAMEGGYHGDTFGAMSAGVGSHFFTPYEDLFFTVDTLPYPASWIGDDAVAEKESACLAALERYLDAHGTEVAAFIIEPLIQGAGGMRMLRPSFLAALVDRLRAAGVLVIFDEVMTGFGRTGGLFACLTAETTPDLICLSKGITGGFLALSATFCTERIYEAFLSEGFDTAFLHGHSFTANPLGCAAGLASLDLLLDDQCRRARTRIEARHRARLEELAAVPGLVRPRICGTVGAIDIEAGDGGYTAAIGPKLKAFFAERGLLIRPLGNVIYLLPPYCVTDDQLDRAWDAVAEAAETLI